MRLLQKMLFGEVFLSIIMQVFPQIHQIVNNGDSHNGRLVPGENESSSNASSPNPFYPAFEEIVESGLATFEDLSPGAKVRAIFATPVAGMLAKFPSNFRRVNISVVNVERAEVLWATNDPINPLVWHGATRLPATASELISSTLWEWHSLHMTLSTVYRSLSQATFPPPWARLALKIPTPPRFRASGIAEITYLLFKPGGTLVVAFGAESKVIRNLPLVADSESSLDGWDDLDGNVEVGTW